jgi:hypothetical protein
MTDYTKNSILLNFTPLTGLALNSYVEVYVNNELRHTEYSDVNLLYVSSIVSGDILKLIVKNLNFADQRIEININRVNYTTDANGDDNGITNTYITGVTGNVITNTYTLDGYFANGTYDSYSYDLVLDVNLPQGNYYDEGKYLLYAATNTGSTQGLGVSTNYGATITPVGPSNITISGFTIEFQQGSISKFGNTMIAPSLYQRGTPPEYLGYTYKSLDYGSTWNPIYGLGNKAFTQSDISFDAQVLTILDINNNLYISNDSGNTWTQKVPSFTVNSLTNGNSGFPQYFAGGDEGGEPFVTDYCYKLESIGGSFIPYTSLGLGYWNTISVSDDNKYIFVGSRNVSSPSTSSKFYISSDSGTTWTQTFTGLTIAVNMDSSMDSSGKYILLSDVTFNRTFLSSDYGLTFTQVLTGAGKNGMVSSSGKYMYVISSDTTAELMKYSTDYGVTWSTINYSPLITNIYGMTINK